MTHDEVTWTIEDIREEAPLVRSLFLRATGDRPAFIPGQYLTVRIPGFDPIEGKSYSISSTHEEELVRLTIKKAGAFSEKLLTYTSGDTLTTSAPYGFFYPEEGFSHPLAFIAGGIGITPIMSIIESCVREGYPSDIHLFYSNKRSDETIFKKRLKELESSFPRLHVHYHLTKEVPREGEVSGRINGTHIVDTLKDVANTDFFVCGSIDFTKSLWKSLRDVGVPANRIYTEGFY